MNPRIHPEWVDSETGLSLLGLVQLLRDSWDWGRNGDNDVEYDVPRDVLEERVRMKTQQESSFSSAATVDQLRLVIQSTGIFGESGLDWGVSSEESVAGRFWNEMSSVISDEFGRIENPFAVQTWESVLKNSFFLKKQSTQMIQEELGSSSDWEEKPWVFGASPTQDVVPRPDIVENEDFEVCVISIVWRLMSLEVVQSGSTYSYSMPWTAKMEDPSCPDEMLSLHNPSLQLWKEEIARWNMHMVLLPIEVLGNRPGLATFGFVIRSLDSGLEGEEKWDFKDLKVAGDYVTADTSSGSGQCAAGVLNFHFFFRWSLKVLNLSCRYLDTIATVLSERKSAA